MRFKNIIIETIHKSGVSYPVPVNITYWWNFGVLALICLVVQIISGIFLAMHYVPNADLAFNSVEHIMRDINYGWFIRYTHANGASMFFLVVYVHIFRNLYYGSYSAPRRMLWCTGVVILLIMILTAFLGYVLPWGQMSFWAATVITNLVSAVPYVGNDILNWLWGGFAVDNATLNRFFSLHYLFPFLLVGLVGAHLVYLHETGSNNAMGIIFNIDKIPFTPYFTIKDIFGIVIFFIVFGFFIYFSPVYLGHPDNFIPANPLVTPNHIVPEWYFLPFYAILRSVPDKLIGVILLLASIIVLLFFPFFLKANISSGWLRPMYQKIFWFFFVNCVLLGWIGGKAIEEPYYIIGQVCTIFYFGYFIFILPILAFFEKSSFYALAKNLEIYDNKIYDSFFLNINNFAWSRNKSGENNKVNTLYFNNKDLLTSILIILAYNQAAFLFGVGDRIPNLLTFFVIFIIYNICISNKLLDLTNLYYYKKNLWFIIYYTVKKFIFNIYNLILIQIQQSFIFFYYYKKYVSLLLNVLYLKLTFTNNILSNLNITYYFFIKLYFFKYFEKKYKYKLLSLLFYTK